MMINRSRQAGTKSQEKEDYGALPPPVWNTHREELYIIYLTENAINTHNFICTRWKDLFGHTVRNLRRCIGRECVYYKRNKAILIVQILPTTDKGRIREPRNDICEPSNHVIYLILCLGVMRAKEVHISHNLSFRSHSAVHSARNYQQLITVNKI